MKISLLKIIFLLFLFSVTSTVFAQIGKVWPSAIDYNLKGKVRSWTMKDSRGIVRQQSFNDKAVLIKDSYKGTPQTYIPPENLPEKLKMIYEAVYTNSTAPTDSINTVLFNGRKQLLKKHTPVYSETNTFNAQGKISVHKQTESITQTRAWNSTGHVQPTYTFTDTISQIVIYKYNASGFIKEFESYNTNPFKNSRMVYQYDSSNHLIETNSYDWLKIPSDLIADKYLDKFVDADIDSNFSINHFFNNYWSQNLPTKRTWKYNQQGEKIEYMVYGYHDGPSFRATWEYDDAGNMLKEIHYDVYHETIRSIAAFDKQGNVIEETDFDYWNKKSSTFYYQITYY